MTCEERTELMILYEADLLDAEQRREIDAHLAGGCKICQAALDDARAVLRELPESVPPVVPPTDAADRLMQRIAMTPRSNATARQSIGWALPAAMAACLGFVAGAFSLYYLQRGRIDSLESLLNAQQLKFVQLASLNNETPARGRIFWDQDAHRWKVYVFDLAPPPPGRAYELWFIKPDQTKIAAGMININASGDGQAEVDVPASIGAIAVAAITDEPTGGVAQPTGQVRLVGKIE